MIKVKSLVSAAVMGLALVGTGAQAAFSSFWYDADGVGGNSAVKIVGGLGLGLSGAVNVLDTFTSATTFNFAQTGTIGIFQGGSVNVVGYGYGTVGGDLVYSSGTVNMFGTNSVNFATFDITGGGASLIEGLTPGANNTVTLYAAAVSFLHGYLFQDVGGTKGTDFADFGDGKPVFAVSTTNFSPIDVPALTYGTDGEGNPIVISASIDAGAGGQLRMEVPEPESLALMGLGLVALAASRRRKTAKAAA